jgi:hypothetical protein
VARGASQYEGDVEVSRPRGIPGKIAQREDILKFKFSGVRNDHDEDYRQCRTNPGSLQRFVSRSRKRASGRTRPAPRSEPALPPSRWPGIFSGWAVTPSKVMRNAFRISEPQQPLFHPHGGPKGHLNSETRCATSPLRWCLQMTAAYEISTT